MFRFVVPAKAGIPLLPLVAKQGSGESWAPAFAGVTRLFSMLLIGTLT